jgi:hypothetical protein
MLFLRLSASVRGVPVQNRGTRRGAAVAASRALVGAVLALGLGLTWGCGGGGGSRSTALSVSVSPKSATVATNATQKFTATVNNDSTHQGVTWSLTQNGVGCTSTCGTLSAVSTASGTATTYTAPSSAPTVTSVTITATAVADSTQSASATIGIRGVGVSISPASAAVPVGGTQQFAATLTNDVGNKGVTWTLTQNGTACAPACGSVSPQNTSSGAKTTYTAPNSPLTVTLTATSVADPNQSASALVTVQAIAVTPLTANVPVAGTQQFTATLVSTLSSQGVTWSLTQNGMACSPGCGSVSPATTNSGSPTTYTGPTSLPALPTVIITATSMADSSQSASATITLEGVTVSVTPTFANVPVNGTQPFTATVANDVSKKGVTWSLTQNGMDCSPTCGKISATSSASGSPITYTAPGSPMTVTLTAASVADTNETVFATIVVQAIAVSVSPTAANVSAGLTTRFTATVTNDVSSKGVTWILTQSGTTSCSPGCGTISPTSTATGVATTYTAPKTVPNPATVTLTATSVTDTSKSATATITVTPPIAVSVSPTSATVVLGATAPFTATVTNDLSNLGAFWTLTQGGASCSPGCGTVSPTTTPSGSPATYTAPSTMPGSSKVTLTATSVTDITKSASATITLSASAALASFSGNFAFLFSGYDTGGAVAFAGRFTADGAGNLTGGLMDSNRASGVTAAQAFTGTYTMGPDGRGAFVLTTASEGAPLGSFAFVLNAAGDKAQFIESDGSGTRGAGIVAIQAPAAPTLAGDYAFGLSGTDPNSSRFSLAGRFHADGAGGISEGMFDSNDGGAVASRVPFAGSYAAAAAGRGTLAAVTPAGTLHWAFYLVSPGEAFLVSTDSRLTAPVTSGKALAQAPDAPGGFSAASLAGTRVLSLAGISRAGTASSVAAGLATFDGAGNLRFSLDENDAGTVEKLASNGTYAVAVNGRATIALTGRADLLIAFLANRNEAFLAGSGAEVSTGLLEAQAPGPFTAASLTGQYIFATAAAPASASPLAWGLMSCGGAGELAGTAESLPAGGTVSPDRAFTDSYAVSSSGRVTTGTGGMVLYLVSPAKAVAVDVAPGKTNATITTIEK